MAQTPTWLLEARSHLGETALKGPDENPYVVGLYALAGHSEIKTDDTPWCAAFVGASLARVGIEGTHSLAASSYIDFGVDLDDPVVGAVAVLDHHVAFVDSIDGDHVCLIGGNQGHSEGRSAVTVARYRRASVLRFAWPVPPVSPADLGAQGSRTIAKGHSDQATGLTATVVGVIAAAQSTPPAAVDIVAPSAKVDPDVVLGIVDHLAKTSKLLVEVVAASPVSVILIVIGVYLIASGTLVKIWRAQDANAGRSLAPAAKGAK